MRAVATLCAVDTTLITRPRRAGVALALAAGLLTGCSAGDDATSRQPYAPADGIYADSGSIRALNVLVVASEGASEGVVLMALANRGTRSDRLTAIDSSAGTVELSSPVELPPGGAVRFGSDADESVSITGLTRAPGETIELTLSFERAEPVTLRTVVMPATGDYADITPSVPAAA